LLVHAAALYGLALARVQSFECRLVALAPVNQKLSYTFGGLHTIQHWGGHGGPPLQTPRRFDKTPRVYQQNLISVRESMANVRVSKWKAKEQIQNCGGEDMKRHTHILLAIIVLAGAFTVSALAQTASAQIAVANIPFSFNVGNKILPAGKYTVTVVNPASDRKILQIRSAKGRSSAMIQTNSVTGNTSDDAKLVFQRYGDRYFFAQAQMAGESSPSS
jgi:hypothetical protein